MKTLSDALALVPEYWPLVPGVDKWEEGDEYCLTEAVKLAKAGWQKIGDGAVGLELPTKDCETRGGWFIVETVIGIGVRIASDYIARRPIPQSVRESEAFWILYKELRFSHYPSSQVKVFSTRKQDNGVLICTDCAWGLFPSDIEKLGGEFAVIQMLTEGPGALWRWVEENRK